MKHRGHMLVLASDSSIIFMALGKQDDDLLGSGPGYTFLSRDDRKVIDEDQIG